MTKDEEKKEIMKKVYVEIYEVVWNEATLAENQVWCSKQFQRIFFTSKAAQEFRKKLLDEGLNPDYTRLDIHKLPVLFWTTNEKLIKAEAEKRKAILIKRKDELELEIQELENYFKPLQVTKPPEYPNSRTPRSLMTGGDNA